MDQGAQEASRSARFLAWASGVLLVAGVVSAGSVVVGDGARDEAVVSATGRSVGTVDVTPTVTVTLPPPSPQPPVASTVRTTTTLPKAAVAVLKAIATTTTTQPAPATTAPTTPPVTTTPSTAPPTTVPPTTTLPPTALPTKATVTLANEQTRAFVVTVNGQAFELAAGQVLAPVDLTPAADGKDVIDVHAQDDPTCALSETSDFFQAGSRYQLTVALGPATCGGGLASPEIDVSTP